MSGNGTRNGRYSRQELFPKIGPDGQRKLGERHVLIVGAGALGSGSAETLVRAGVGTVTIVDRDYVEPSNLQRQQLYSEEDALLRLPKAAAAKARLERINPDIDIRAVVADVAIPEIDELAQGVNVILDGTDNFETRLLINDMSQKKGIPWIYGACVGSYGLTFTVVPGRTPCLHCLLETMPPGGATCDTAGIIGPAAQMVAAYQTSEALKLLVDDGEALHGKLISFDLWTGAYAAIRVERMKKPNCPSCGLHRTYPFLQPANQPRAAVLCGRDTVQIRPPAPVQRDLKGLARRLSRQGGEVRENPYLVSFAAEGCRLTVFQDGRVLVHGTKDITEAKSLYHRYLG
ncbi:thiazole biosynthesis adenylyltransferase ThiF [Paenibacillus cookii]|uniref:Thiazole biosynthesis adenylyltransferase ThiF n=1 Tax=Paenibacillus cookii TaxID=157839 RepID=A0ABQ4LR52_9BACL|nr:thiazole biosynthesis adenylyltransferase ThiF [Paenibacillus cookii]GIO65717.1 thiazole biosynthesis adenylyltransferase ThiF [Paenibacillus cookii]